METIISKVGKFKWGVASILLGLFAPGFYQMFINNAEFVRAEGIEKTLWFAGIVSLPTYAVLVFGTFILIAIYRFFQFIILSSTSGRQILPYGFLAGNLNILLVWPENKFDAYTDDFRKYLFFLIDNWEWIFFPISLLCLAITFIIINKIIEKIMG